GPLLVSGQFGDPGGGYLVYLLVDRLFQLANLGLCLRFCEYRRSGIRDSLQKLLVTVHERRPFASGS
ncbi:MAG: hypothetical protein ACLTMI_10525, partial [Collinsella sp.]